MKHVPTLLLVSVWILMPTSAGANDGGWLDWLYHLDLKLVGVGTEFHLLCVDGAGTARRCEDLYGLIRRSPTKIPFEQIKHRIDFRVAFYWKYGERFSDVIDQRSVKAFKLMGMYYYHFGPGWQLGGGAGYMPFFGDGFDLFSRGIVTPVSLVWSPFSKRGHWKKFFVRVEESYLMQGFSGADLGNSETGFSFNGKWNPSFAVGFRFFQ